MAARSIPDPEHSRQVLIVDDDETARLLLRELLIADGLTVIEAGDGAGALKKFEAHRPDLVLLDIDMPGMDGLTACAQMRELEPAETVPIVMVSGHQDAATINEAYSRGVNDFVLKPVNPALLSNRIRGLIADRSDPETSAGSGNSDRLLSAIPDQLFALDRSGRIIEYSGPNGLVREQLETAGDPATIRSIWPVFIAESLLTHVRRALKTRKECSWTFVDENGGEVRHFEVRFLPQGRNRVLMIQRDVSGQAESDARISRLGLMDDVTGLPNRLQFLRNLDNALVEAQFRFRSLALVLFDVRGLDRVREGLGVEAVDAVLQKTAERIRGSSRSADSLAQSTGNDDDKSVARLEGIGFAAILSNIGGREDAASFSDRMMDSLRLPVRFGEHEIRCEVQSGLAIYPEDAGDVESLLKVAEKNLAEMDLPEMTITGIRKGQANGSSRIRNDLLDELSWAFEQQQFELHYLPKFDTRNRRIQGVEALLRWRHPLRGLVPLGEFFPLMQDSGLIVPVGDWVLQTACDQLGAWDKDGLPPLLMAVNCSAQQFVLGDFVDRVAQALDTSGIESGRLEIEFDENMLMRNLGDSTEKLQQLKSLGIGLALDDFGTGFSSLRYLARLPLDALKIDRAFVAGLPDRTDAVSICGAIVDLAHRFGMEAVAEGVESDGQVALLTELGCDQMQGFLFTRPVQADDLPRFLLAQREEADQPTSGRIAATP